MKEWAEGFRELAKAAEDRGGMDFTCNRVLFKLGREAEAAYKALYEFDRGEWGNEFELWDLPDQANVRVLMLCFAAALAEAGDL